MARKYVDFKVTIFLQNVDVNVKVSLYFCKMKRQFYIYKLTSPSGKVYIGQTYNIKERFYKYTNANCYKQYLLQRALKKYGWENFKKETLVNGFYEKNIINITERKLIKRYKKLKISLNITNGGEGRNTSAGEYNVASIPVLQFDKNGIFIKRWDNMSIAIRNLKLSRAFYRTRKIDNFYKGYYWILESEYTKDYVFKRRENQRGSAVIQYTISGEFIKEYRSIREAEIGNNIKLGTLWIAIKRNCKTSQGFQWKIKN